MINYTKGITRNPGELMAEDGTLLECINLKCEDGELRPMLWPEPSNLTLNTGERLIYIHRGSGYKNYFVTSGSTVKAFYTTADGTRKDYTFSHTFKQDIKFEAIGNTVIILDADGMHYILYKNADYTYLGQQFPECPISFGLQGELKYYSKENGYFKVMFAEDISWSDYYTKPFTDENKKTITEQILAKVNQFIKEESTDKGRFMFPFLVRYAYRLYDGTLTHHSAPVLMVASSYPNPYVPSLGNLTEGDGEPKEGAVLDIVAVTSQLDYALLDASVKTSLKEWGDIIKSVDIFISAPIYTYNQNASIERFINAALDNGTTNETYLNSASFVGKIVGSDRPDGKDFDSFPTEEGVTGGTLLTQYYQRWNIVELYQALTRKMTGQLYAELPLFSKSVVNENIRDCSNFYLLKSIRTDELSTSRTLIPVDETYLQSLQARELMTDEYRSHDRISAASMYAYNGRLNIHDITRTLFQGSNPASLYQYTNGAVDISLELADKVVNPTFKDESSTHCGAVNIQTLMGESDEVWFPYLSATENFDLREVGLYTYFPNPNAIGFIVGAYNSGAWDNLKPNFNAFDYSRHRLLNGAVHFYGLDRRYGEGMSLITDTSSVTVTEPNKIYTSEVNNPFIFPVSGVNTIGTGDIIRIVSTTKALSQGQFGQFPLLVLTTDGIWAMTVNDEGLYSTKQVLSRDVCNNPDSIVQTDNLVFFTSERGLMAIDGSQVICVSEHMKGLPANATTMPRMDKLAPAFVSACADNSDIQQFLRQSHAGYSYRENALYFTNPAYTYTWVFRISSQTWTKLWKDGTTPADFINDYPDTLMQDTAGNIYSLLTEPDMSATAQQGFAMTRTLKLGDPTAMKRIRQLKNIKNIVAADSSVKYALWGSNDGIRWYSVTGFVGGFKFYRMALFTMLKPSESLLGTAMITEKKQSNKLR